MSLFCKAGGIARLLALTLCLAVPALAQAQQPSSQQPAGISIQLWSVKDALAEDYRGTLEALADMGFDGVELAGAFGPFEDDPEGLRDYLDELGLAVSGAHVEFEAFEGDRLEETVAFYRTLGTDKLIIPADNRAWSADGIDELAADLTRLAERLEPHGMQTGYHNHHSEFDSYRDTTYWGYLAEKTPDTVLLQLDVGWTHFAGQDPQAQIRRYRDRIVTLHFKATATRHEDVRPALEEADVNSWGEEMDVVFDYNQKQANGDSDTQPLIGRDAVDWDAVIEATHSVDRPVWYVVEQEIYPKGMTPLEAVEASLKGLREQL